MVSRLFYSFIGLVCIMATTSFAGSSVIETHRRAIQADLTKNGLDAKAYELSMLDKWDHKRLPVMIADPTQARLEQRIAIYYAVLPDGTLVSAYHRPFQRILQTAYKNFTAADAKALAQLSTIFGDFGEPVGFVSETIRTGAVGDAKLPRPDGKIVTKQDGGATVIEFYSYQPSLGRMFDCSVRIKDGKAELKARMLPKNALN